MKEKDDYDKTNGSEGNERGERTLPGGHDEKQGSPSALPVELIFWGAVLIILGYGVYIRMGTGMRLAPWASLGRVVILLGATILAEQSSRTDFRRNAFRFLAIVTLGNMVWIVAWAVSQLSRISGADGSAGALIVRCSGLTGCADTLIFLGICRLCRLTGIVTNRSWRIGAGIIAISGILMFITSTLHPKSWSLISQRMINTHWIFILNAMKIVYWFAVLLVLVRVRQLRRFKWRRL